MDKLENFRAIWTFTRHFDNISQTNKLWQKIILFCIPTDQEKTQSAHMLQHAVSRALSTEHNK